MAPIVIAPIVIAPIVIAPIVIGDEKSYSSRFVFLQSWKLLCILFIEFIMPVSYIFNTVAVLFQISGGFPYQPLYFKSMGQVRNKCL